LFLKNKTNILNSIEDELCAYRLFIADVTDEKIRKRIEFAIMHNIYFSKQPWADLVDGCMALSGRSNKDIPVNLINICSNIIYGLPQILEI
jgi:hypothetical protein